jgi:hypothetical protein
MITYPHHPNTQPYTIFAPSRAMSNNNPRNNAPRRTPRDNEEEFALDYGQPRTLEQERNAYVDKADDFEHEIRHRKEKAQIR